MKCINSVFNTILNLLKGTGLNEINSLPLYFVYNIPICKDSKELIQLLFPHFMKENTLSFWLCEGGKKRLAEFGQ